MINSTKGRELALRVLGEVCFWGSFEFEHFLPFLLVCRFSYHLLVLWFYLLLDDHLELFFTFWSSSCASYGLGFKIQTLCLVLSMYSSRGRLRNQVLLGLLCNE
jgi:hypothetical protein